MAVHVLCEGRHQRQVLREHEHAFCCFTPSRRLFEQALLRLGPAAQSYYEGLKIQRGRGTGYPMQRILELADRYGSNRVAGALAHVARYGNYSAEAVARVLTGGALRRLRKGDGAAPAMPAERVRLWLEGMDVESSDLGDNDRLIDGLEPRGDAAGSDEAGGAGEPEPDATAGAGGSDDGGGGGGGGDGDAGSDVEEG